MQRHRPLVLVVGEHQNAGFDLLTRLKRQGVLDLLVVPEGSQVDLSRHISRADLLVCRPARHGWIGPGVLSQAKPTLVIASPSRGLDHIAFPEETSFRVVSLSDENSPALSKQRDAVVRLTVLLAQVLLRPIDLAIGLVTDGKWDNSFFDNSDDLNGADWFVFGSGGQVRHLIPLLRGQHVARCVVHNPGLTPPKFQGCLTLLDSRLCHQTDPFRAVCSLDGGGSMEILGTTTSELLGHATVVSLHVPALKQPLLDDRRINQCRPGVSIVNTARGALIDEPVVAAAIRDGRVRYAADVIHPLAEQTGDPEHSELWRLSRETSNARHRLILTPHMGANTKGVLDVAFLEVLSKALPLLNISPEVVH